MQNPRRRFGMAHAHSRRRPGGSGDAPGPTVAGMKTLDDAPFLDLFSAEFQATDSITRNTF